MLRELQVRRKGSMTSSKRTLRLYTWNGCKRGGNEPSTSDLRVLHICVSTRDVQHLHGEPQPEAPGSQTCHRRLDANGRGGWARRHHTPTNSKTRFASHVGKNLEKRTHEGCWWQTYRLAANVTASSSRACVGASPQALAAYSPSCRVGIVKTFR
jgi:hypothetical protein